MTHNTNDHQHADVANANHTEVADALAGLSKAIEDKRRLVDVGPELMSGLVRFIKDNNVQPRTIKSKAQAKRMTANDPDGYHWRVGERYFVLVARKGA
jgi:hypothetical protein